MDAVHPIADTSKRNKTGDSEDRLDDWTMEVETEEGYFCDWRKKKKGGLAF